MLLIAVVLVVDLDLRALLPRRLQPARGGSRSPARHALDERGQTIGADQPRQRHRGRAPRRGSTGCPGGTLKLAAATAAPSFQLGASRRLALQVTNTGSNPCVADLSDTQIELRVYNGSARVWGSHDCQIQPGTS